MTEFEDIYKTYFTDVYRFLLKLCGDENTAEEIRSDTFFKALGSIGSFRGDCDLRVWLCQIAKNCYFTYRKKASRIIPADDVETSLLQAPSDSPEELAVKKDEAERIKMILHDLPEPYKEVFMWRVFAEMDFRQIGQIFKKSENWACVTFYRAKKMIISKTEEQNRGK